MEKVYGLENWTLDKAVANNKRFVDVKINLPYPYPYADQKLLIDFKPKERIKKIDEAYRENLKILMDLKLIGDYNLIGKKKRPTGITTKIKFNDLKKLSNLGIIADIRIISIDHAVKTPKAEVLTEKYFCVKMTVVIEEEGRVYKKQKIEKRFVLIKATSFEEAYDKVEKQADDYCVPYLNIYGRFVRWRIDSYDDCFVTNIENPADLENPEGVEVFSALKSRKNKSKKEWDGKF